MMPSRPIDDATLTALAGECGTPLYVYNAGAIRRQAATLSGFDIVRYAQKANSNLAILRLIRSLGFRVDAVSAGEVLRALRAGFSEQEITFTADIFDRAALQVLSEHDVHVNIGSADMIEQYAHIRPGGDITLRINPGFGHGHDKKVSTGGEESKHGIWMAQQAEAVKRAEAAGLRITGIHMHIGSGSDFSHLSKIRHAMNVAIRVAGDNLSYFSVGGGLPVPYRPMDHDFDIGRYTRDWQKTKADLQQDLGHGLVMEVEPGRYLMAQAGLLLAEVRAVKTSGSQRYILCDAGFNDLLRPAMYGAYHHVSIVGRDTGMTFPTLVGGPICESADLMTQSKGSVVDPRELPEAQVGDLVCIHDTGAYGASMGSNYNSRRLPAEVLIDGGEATLIRRRQSWEELLELEDLPHKPI